MPSRRSCSNARKPPRGANVNRRKLATLARPYPRAVAGTPTDYGFDPATGEFTLRYSTEAPAGRRLVRRRLTEVFLPRVQYPHGYTTQATGATVVSDPGARVLELRRRAGAARVGLTVNPDG